MVRKTILIQARKKDIETAWKQWKKDNAVLYRSLLTNCSGCGTIEYLGIHHKNGDKRDCIAENLSCFCFKCHLVIHNKIFIVRYLDSFDLQGGLETTE